MIVYISENIWSFVISLMIRLYIRAINSKDKNTLLKVAQDASAYYIDSYQKRSPFYLKHIQALLNTNNALKECWMIVSNTHGRNFIQSKFWTGLNFVSLPFLVVFRSKEEALSNLFHYFFFYICPVSDISTKLMRDVFQVKDQYISVSSSLFLSFCEVMNIRLFLNGNKKMNLMEIFFQTLVTSYCLHSVSIDFNAIEKFIPNRFIQYFLKRIRLAVVSSFISLICSIGFSNGMRVTFEEWLFSLFKLFKTHFSPQMKKVSKQININNTNDDNNNDLETNYDVEVVDHIDINFNISYISNINNFVQVSRVSDKFGQSNKNQILKKDDDSDLFINILNNGKLSRHLFVLNDMQNISTYDLIKNAYYYKVNVVIPPKQIQCPLCHHLLKKPVESFGYFFCNDCIKKYIRQYQNKDLKSSYVKNPITGDLITEKSLYKSPFMNYIIYRYKLFLLDDCIEEYKIEQAKRCLNNDNNNHES